MEPGLEQRASPCSPQPNLQEVLFVMGGRSLDDEDEDEDEESDPRVQPRNCAFYNIKTSTYPPPQGRVKVRLLASQLEGSGFKPQSPSL